MREGRSVPLLLSVPGVPRRRPLVGARRGRPGPEGGREGRRERGREGGVSQCERRMEGREGGREGGRDIPAARGVLGLACSARYRSYAGCLWGREGGRERGREG